MFDTVVQFVYKYIVNSASNPTNNGDLFKFIRWERIQRKSLYNLTISGVKDVQNRAMYFVDHISRICFILYLPLWEMGHSTFDIIRRQPM